MLKDVDINEEAASLKRKPNNIEIRGCKGGDEQVKQIVTLSTSQHNKQYTQLKLQITANIEKTKPAKFQNCETTLPPIDRSKIPPSGTLGQFERVLLYHLVFTVVWLPGAWRLHGGTH